MFTYCRALLISGCTRLPMRITLQYSGTSDFDLGKKIWILGGVFWNFGFGLRKNSWIFGFLGGGGGILELQI